jgi:putative aminopeptidase FrvX
LNIDIEKILDKMKKYLDIPSPTGYTKEAITEVQKDFEYLGLSTQLTKKGALIATLGGQNDDEHVMLSAHIDTLGAMVKEITNDGKLKYNKVGGGSWSAIEGENCYIITRKGKRVRGSIVPKMASTHIYGQEKANVARDQNNMLVRIDEIVKSKADVLKLGINVGDFIALDTRTEITESGFVKSRYLDNKLAVAILLEICRYFKENSITPKYTTHFYISNYEEAGHGVSVIPEKTKEMIAIDVGIVGEGQESNEFSVSIAAKDKKSPYNFEFRNKLVDIAEENNIDYVVDVYNFYSSDATQCMHQGKDVNFASLGPAVDSSHHYERTHVRSILNTTKLLIKYLY